MTNSFGLNLPFTSIYFPKETQALEFVQIPTAPNHVIMQNSQTQNASLSLSLSLLLSSQAGSASACVQVLQSVIKDHSHHCTDIAI